MATRSFAQRFRQRFVRQYMVRFHMSLLLAATLGSGMLFSKLLLMAGLHSVLFRYPISVLAAYLVFTGLTRLWVTYVLIDVVAGRERSWFSSRSSSSYSGVDPGADLPLPGGSSSGSVVSFGGGDSGGAGASDLWDASASQLSSAPIPGGSGGGGFHFPSIDLDIDFDDGFWILVVLGLLIVVLAGAGGYLIWAAPQILPDLALNALLASSLAGAAKRAETRGWMVSVLRATCIPLLLILGVTIALAAVVHHHCPGAEKLSTALACPDEMRPAH
jgi:hypothetical protein